MNQSFAISSEKQRCLADAINLLGVVLIRPSGGRSILIYLKSTYGPMTSYIPTARRVEDRAYPSAILGMQLVVGLTAEHGRATGRGTSTQAQRLTDSWPFWESESVPPVLCPY